MRESHLDRLVKHCRSEVPYRLRSKGWILDKNHNRERTLLLRGTFARRLPSPFSVIRWNVSTRRYSVTEIHRTCCLCFSPEIKGDQHGVQNNEAHQEFTFCHQDTFELSASVLKQFFQINIRQTCSQKLCQSRDGIFKFGKLRRTRQNIVQSTRI